MSDETTILSTDSIEGRGTPHAAAVAEPEAGLAEAAEALAENLEPQPAKRKKSPTKKPCKGQPNLANKAKKVTSQKTLHTTTVAAQPEAAATTLPANERRAVDQKVTTIAKSVDYLSRLMLAHPEQAEDYAKVMKQILGNPLSDQIILHINERIEREKKEMDERITARIATSIQKSFYWYSEQMKQHPERAVDYAKVMEEDLADKLSSVRQYVKSVDAWLALEKSSKKELARLTERAQTLKDRHDELTEIKFR